MHDVSDTISMWCSSLSGNTKEATGKVRVLLLVGAVVAVGVGAVYGYKWYRVSQEEVAQRVLARNVQEFERIVQDGKKEDWASVESLFKISHDQYASTAIAPFFLLYQAEAMIKQDKIEQARELIAQAIDVMGSSCPLCPLFTIKLALMKMDTDEQEAVKILQQLAQDTKSHFSDAAAYYLGEHYWIKQEYAKAKQVWQAMIQATKTEDANGQSPWAGLAQEKLAQIA